MKYIEIYNENNILQYRIEVKNYQIDNRGINFFTDGFDIDFDMMFKGITEIDELNNKISYDIDTCRGEEYFKVKLIDEGMCYVCEKVLLGMTEGDQLFFIPLINEEGARYYITFCDKCKVEFSL